MPLSVCFYFYLLAVKWKSNQVDCLLPRWETEMKGKGIPSPSWKSRKNSSARFICSASALLPVEICAHPDSMWPPRNSFARVFKRSTENVYLCQCRFRSVEVFCPSPPLHLSPPPLLARIISRFMAGATTHKGSIVISANWGGKVFLVEFVGDTTSGGVATTSP